MSSLTNDPGGAASPATMIGPLPSGQRDRRSSEIKAFCPPDRPLQGPGENPCAECAPGRLMCQIAAPYAAANTPDKITTIPSTTDRASDNISNPRDEHTMIRSPLFPSRSDAGRRERVRRSEAVLFPVANYAGVSQRFWTGSPTFSQKNRFVRLFIRMRESVTVRCPLNR